MNKVEWFEKQLQHKTELEGLKISAETEAYVLSMPQPFVLDCYEEDNAEPALVAVTPGNAIDTAECWQAGVEPGKRYRLQVNDRAVLFKILTRKIWFFESMEALRTDLKRKDQALEPAR